MLKKEELDTSRKSVTSEDRVSHDGSTDIAAHTGVEAVKATHKVYGKYSRWCLFIGIGLASYIYSLDSQTTYSYLAFAASALKDHSLISTIQTAQAIIVACGKPVIAKVADVSSRGFAYVFVLVFYVVGYIVIASAQNIQTVAGGIILYAIGYTGLQLLTSIIIADITTLQWRGFAVGMTSMPFIINAFIGSNVSTQVLDGAGWRWGYGMFAILIPVSLSPLIITLVWAERKAKRLGLVPEKPKSDKSFLEQTLEVISQLDVVGLVLIGTSVALILLPLTLAPSASGGWNNPSMIAMLVIGCVLFPAVGPWEFKFAKYPVIPLRFITNFTVVGASLIGFFDYISFYLTYVYLYSFVIVVKPWSLINATYFIQTQSVGLTFFGILCGLAMRFLHRYKLLLVVGLAIRLLGVGLMIHSRGANGSDVEIVWTQIIQSMGGGMSAITIQTAAQASVSHKDVATVTAIVLLLTEIGGAIGDAVAGAIWTNLMPRKLLKYLPDVSQEERDALYSSITSVTAYARGTEIREGVISAYGDVMKIMLIVATVMSVIPLAISLFMPDWHLGEKQNAVDEEDLAGEVDHNDAAESRA
ncbi:drug:h+ antiporter [Guyanagaster necrorhizus]|uniref:Drug:h+ antiporter n=1 Tax=Guyanagaster necrorhizus TaxID=856835 RepID=A0A9P7W0J6_9AGAR|nr:drug:h+ antiporter [Guyanagaster necrorhizus MCA 3950]KAG7449141.1 drug:h+ antiporter [Guyanagaster necrorhizus MCA 3950]